MTYDYCGVRYDESGLFDRNRVDQIVVCVYRVGIFFGGDNCFYVWEHVLLDISMVFVGSVRTEMKVVVMNVVVVMVMKMNLRTV